MTDTQETLQELYTRILDDANHSAATTTLLRKRKAPQTANGATAEQATSSKKKGMLVGDIDDDNEEDDEGYNSDSDESNNNNTASSSSSYIVPTISVTTTTTSSQQVRQLHTTTETATSTPPDDDDSNYDDGYVDLLLQTGFQPASRQYVPLKSIYNDRNQQYATYSDSSSESDSESESEPGLDSVAPANRKPGPPTQKPGLRFRPASASIGNVANDVDSLDIDDIVATAAETQSWSPTSEPTASFTQRTTASILKSSSNSSSSSKANKSPHRVQFSPRDSIRFACGCDDHQQHEQQQHRQQIQQQVRYHQQLDCTVCDKHTTTVSSQQRLNAAAAVRKRKWSILWRVVQFVVVAILTVVYLRVTRT